MKSEIKQKSNAANERSGEHDRSCAWRRGSEAAAGSGFIGTYRAQTLSLVLFIVINNKFF